VWDDLPSREDAAHGCATRTCQSWPGWPLVQRRAARFYRKHLRLLQPFQMPDALSERAAATRRSAGGSDFYSAGAFRRARAFRVAGAGASAGADEAPRCLRRC
jgi:hypothetical protein